VTPERQRLVEEVFLAAIEAGAERWMSVVESRCGSDTELRAEVEGLLGCHQDDKGDGVLDRAAPVGQSLLQGFEKVALGEVPMPPTGKIGHYKISRVLGAGGMGAVYVGEQDRPRRTVALKVIRPGYRSEQVLKRMEHEAELLGRLHHPGIAQIYEAGSADAWGQGPQPFFAMELVDGPPITDYCNNKKLTTRERLALMAGVCDAVQHAHQRGVIHRDIKPGNILVGIDGQPKVLDFGVARATGDGGGGLYANTLHTSVGQMIGTLPYMSPEQVAADPDQIDTRTDVYSLGVVIYELLTGQLPHQLRNRPIPEAARVIRDEEPTKLGSVRRDLRGEVEIIVSRAMEKDKTRRYASAAELAADIRRFLAGEPIYAKRDSGFYVIRKTLFRHKGVAALIGVVTLLVVGFGVYASMQAARFRDKAFDEGLARARADGALKRAQEESKRNEELNGQLQRQLNASAVERGRLEAIAENGAGAERFLWPALFKDPSDDAAWWALRELYGRFPCDWDTRLRSWLTGVSVRNGLIAVCDRMGGLTVLSADDGTVRASIPGALVVGPTGSNCISFVGDDLIAVFAGDGTARVFGYQPGKLTELVQWTVHNALVSAAQTSPAGDVLATVGFDGMLRLWTVPGMTLDREIRCGPGPLSVTFSPDGRRVATGANDGSVSIWSRSEGTRVRRIETSDAPISALLFSRDGRTIYCGGNERRVDAWSVEDGTRRPGLGVTQGDVNGIAFAPVLDALPEANDRLAVSSTLGSRIVVQDPAPSSRLLAYNAVGFSRAAWSGGRLITVGIDGHVRCWDARAQPSQTVLGPHKSWIFSTEFSPDGQRVATAGGDGSIRLWNPRSGALLREAAVDGLPLLRPKYPPRARMLRWVSPDLFVTGGADGMLRFHKADDASVIQAVAAAKGEIYGLAVSADGSRIATVGTDRALRVWNTTTRKLDWEATDLQVFARGVAFSPDGKKLYSGGSNAGVTVWDTSTHARIGLLPTSTAPWSIAASPDGERIGVGTMEAGVDIIELSTATRIGGPSGHFRVVASVVFSPDSKLLFSGGDDGTVKVWEAAHARLLSSFESGLGEVPSVGISPDGTLLAYGCQGRAAIVRDVFYHDRHIAANLEAAIAQYGRDGGTAENFQYLRRWAMAERLRAGMPSGSNKPTGE
jgi:WD40 repeat protein